MQFHLAKVAHLFSIIQVKNSPVVLTSAVFCIPIYQMRQGHGKKYCLCQIQKELTNLIKNPKRFCKIFKTDHVQCLGGSPGHCTSQHRPALALHMLSFENFAKPLWILYQISKLFLDLAQAISSAMTLPHLMYTSYENTECTLQLNGLPFFIRHFCLDNNVYIICIPDVESLSAHSA